MSGFPDGGVYFDQEHFHLKFKKMFLTFYIFDKNWIEWNRVKDQPWISALVKFNVRWMPNSASKNALALPWELGQDESNDTLQPICEFEVRFPSYNFF